MTRRTFVSFIVLACLLLGFDAYPTRAADEPQPAPGSVDKKPSAKATATGAASSKSKPTSQLDAELMKSLGGEEKQSPDKPITTEAKPKSIKPEAEPAPAAKPIPKPGEKPVEKPAPKPLAAKPAVPWLEALAKGMDSARKTNRPVLVKFDASFCGWCVKLDEEFAKPAIARRLKNFVLVKLDVQRDSDDAQTLNASATPALRVLAPSGRLAASQDGYLPEDELGKWLDAAEKEIAATPEADLASMSEPSVLEVMRIVGVFKVRDARLREAAVSRLRMYPRESAVAVVAALRDGNLQSRLAALDLLGEWNAPVDKLDPWRMETFGKPERDALEAWSKKAAAADNPKPWAPTPQELAGAKGELGPMLTGTDAEASAIRERLAKFGPTLIPAVVERLRETDDDTERERLAMLRYRLAASPRRALDWPGGIYRLASLDVEERRRAADELTKRARKDDEALLLELFGDDDALVRELGLRGLRIAVGSGANAVLTKLLDDPEPNIRAAVLKQWAEDPSPALLPRLSKYVNDEKDLDLLVHAVRVVREIKEGSLPILLKLLKHEAWQVRAEAAEGIAKRVNDYSGGLDASQKADAYAALVERLDDPDTFVVSRALEGLKSADLPAAVKPMIAAMKRAPDLTPAVVGVLAGNGNFMATAEKTIREMTKHESPDVRAKAIEGLCKADGVKCDAEILAALGDSASVVRTAAAEGVWHRAREEIDRREQEERNRATGAIVPAASRPKSMLGSLAETLFGGSSSEAKPADKPADKPAEKPAAKTPEPQASPIVVALRKLVKATDEEERSAVLCALAGLGFFEETFEPIVAEITRNPKQVSAFSGLLPALDWDPRKKLFRAFVKASPDTVNYLSYQIGRRSDDRLAREVWRLFEDPRIPQSALFSYVDTLLHAYIGERTWDLQNADPAAKKRMRTDLYGKLARGNTAERMVALSLLARFDPDAAYLNALAVLDGEFVHDAPLRRAALAIALLVCPEAKREELPVQALLAGDAEFRLPALAALVRDYELLMDLDDHHGLYGLSGLSVGSTYASSHQPFDAKAPKSLPVAELRKIANSSDRQAAIYAAYLRIMLNDSDDPLPLLEAWEAEPKKSPRRRLLTRALAYLDEPESLPLLERIWQSIEPRDSTSRSDFYWTVRIMQCEGVLALRKKCREEAGTEILR